MRVTPIRYVRDLPSAQRFYEALGLGRGFTSRPTRHGHSMWSELEAASGALALHHVPEGEHCPAVELALEATEPLEDVIARLRAAGYEPETELTDESFGLSFRVRDPEGLLIQVNKHDHDLQR
jgi:catechol 2,3-dioxygenase-like lactoylglutathione lyase family enzyme